MAFLIFILPLLIVNPMVASQPLGFSFGPRALTVVEPAQNGSVAHLMQVVPGMDYSLWYAEAARLSKINKIPASYEPLEEALRSVATRLPQHFDNISQVSFVALPPEVHCDALSKFIMGKLSRMDAFRGSSQWPHDFVVLKNRHAIHYAFELGSCASLGLEENCDLRFQVSVAILIGLNPHSTSLSLVVLGPDTANSLAEAKLEDEEEGRGVFPSPNASYIQSLGQIAFKAHLTDFITANTLVEKSRVSTRWEPKPLRSDIRAVVLYGDASAEDFRLLKDVLPSVFTFLPPGWLRDTIDPSIVLALGAAKRAKDFQDFPDEYGMGDYTINDSDLHDIDELLLAEKGMAIDLTEEDLD